jgi:hypothetical protein
MSAGVLCALPDAARVLHARQPLAFGRASRLLGAVAGMVPGATAGREVPDVMARSYGVLTTARACVRVESVMGGLK